MDPVTGGLLGLGVGGIKSIFDAIAHANAVRKAAKANTFAFGGRAPVEGPGATPSAIGSIISGGASGAALGQNMQSASAANALMEAKANLWKAISQGGGNVPEGAFSDMMGA